MENYESISDYIFMSDELCIADVIIVPGSSRKELAERASDLIEKGFAPYAIVSGSKNSKLDVTEAEFLANMMIEMGCNPSQIIKECEATNTYENAKLSLSKCLEYGINPHKIIIVCKNYHSRRVQLTFQRVFEDSEIMISPVCDSTNITPDNWHITEEKRAVVFGEVHKIEKYFKQIRCIGGEMVTLQEATIDNIHEVWEMQVKAFEDLLQKYQDYDMSPGAESFENIMAKFNQPWTKYYFILDGNQKVGCVRIIDKQDGSRRRVSPIWIMAEHRNKGYAQQTFDEIEKLYGPDNWSLDTILQEEGNVHLYEKVGYHQTGEIEHIKDGMDIVFFEKN